MYHKHFETSLIFDYGNDKYPKNQSFAVGILFMYAIEFYSLEIFIIINMYMYWWKFQKNFEFEVFIIIVWIFSLKTHQIQNYT